MGSRQSKQAEKEQEEEARRHDKVMEYFNRVVYHYSTIPLFSYYIISLHVLQVEKKKEKDKQYRRDKRQDEAAAKRGTDPFNGAKVQYCVLHTGLETGFSIVSSFQPQVPIFKRPLPGVQKPQVP